MLTCPQQVSFLLLKAKYFPSIDFWSAHIPSSSSSLWKAISEVKGVLFSSSCWVVGNGCNINFWCDNWIVGSSPRFVKWVPQSPTVSDVICNGHWNGPLLAECLNSEQAATVQQIPLPYNRTMQDSLTLKPQSKGFFTVKSAYYECFSMSHQILVDRVKIRLLRALTQIAENFFPRLRLFTWKFLSFILSTRDHLFHKGIISMVLCNLCSSQPKSEAHLFGNCCYFWSIWRHFGFPFPAPRPPTQLLCFYVQHNSLKRVLFFLLICY